MRGGPWSSARRRDPSSPAIAIAIAIAALVLAGVGCGRERPRGGEVMFAAATSLRFVFPDLAAAWAAMHPDTKLVATFGASGDLRKQVEGGAPIDGVLLADGKTVDQLVQSGRVDAASRRVVATNRLVLVGPKGASPLTFATLATLPPGETIAIGDPGAVPAGRYAKEALTRLGVWDAIRSRVVLGGDVAAVLAYARRGEVAAAVVYETEIRGVADVVVLDRATGDWVPRVEVVGAVVKDAKGAESAAAALELFASPAGQKVLGAHGFGPP